MPNEMLPMSTWTPKDGQTYEIVDAEARERITELEEHGGGGGGSGTVTSVNNVQPDANGNVNLSASDVHALPDSTVIPTVPQMATQADMSDWTAGKTVDAAALATDFSQAIAMLGSKADASALNQYRLASFQDVIDANLGMAIAAKYTKPSGGIPASDLAAGVIPTVPTAVSQLANDRGYQTAAQVQTAISPLQTKAITDTGGYYTTDTVEGALQEIGAELASASSASVPRIAKTASDTTATIEPNKMYVFPEMASLTITLADPADLSIVNEYHFVFDSGSTATVLTLPASVLQPDGFSVEANMHYEISILEGAMTAQGWAVTSA